MKLTRYNYHTLMIKDMSQMMEFIPWLIFIKIVIIILKRILFTDTDSLVYEIKSKNISEDFFKRKDLFDFSNYSEDSEFFNKTNKRTIGKMKDEFGGVIATESVGLISKMYSIKK